MGGKRKALAALDTNKRTAPKLESDDSEFSTSTWEKKLVGSTKTPKMSNCAPASKKHHKPLSTSLPNTRPPRAKQNKKPSTVTARRRRKVATQTQTEKQTKTSSTSTAKIDTVVQPPKATKVKTTPSSKSKYFNSLKENNEALAGSKNHHEHLGTGVEMKMERRQNVHTQNPSSQQEAKKPSSPPRLLSTTATKRNDASPFTLSATETETTPLSKVVVGTILHDDEDMDTDSASESIASSTTSSPSSKKAPPIKLDSTKLSSPKKHQESFEQVPAKRARKEAPKEVPARRPKLDLKVAPKIQEVPQETSLKATVARMVKAAKTRPPDNPEVIKRLLESDGAPHPSKRSRPFPTTIGGDSLQHHSPGEASDLTMQTLKDFPEMLQRPTIAPGANPTPNSQGSFDVYSVESDDANRPFLFKLGSKRLLHPPLPPGWGYLEHNGQLFYAHPLAGKTNQCPRPLPNKSQADIIKESIKNGVLWEHFYGPNSASHHPATSMPMPTQHMMATDPTNIGLPHPSTSNMHLASVKSSVEVIGNQHSGHAHHYSKYPVEDTKAPGNQTTDSFEFTPNTGHRQNSNEHVEEPSTMSGLLRREQRHMHRGSNLSTPSAMSMADEKKVLPSHKSMAQEGHVSGFKRSASAGKDLLERPATFQGPKDVETEPVDMKEDHATYHGKSGDKTAEGKVPATSSVAQAHGDMVSKMTSFEAFDCSLSPIAETGNEDRLEHSSNQQEEEKAVLEVSSKTPPSPTPFLSNGDHIASQKAIELAIDDEALTDIGRPRVTDHDETSNNSWVSPQIAPETDAVSYHRPAENTPLQAIDSNAAKTAPMKKSSQETKQSAKKPAIEKASRSSSNSKSLLSNSAKLEISSSGKGFRKSTGSLSSNKRLSLLSQPRVGLKSPAIRLNIATGPNAGNTESSASQTSGLDRTALKLESNFQKVNHHVSAPRKPSKTNISGVIQVATSSHRQGSEPQPQLIQNESPADTDEKSDFREVTTPDEAPTKSPITKFDFKSVAAKFQTPKDPNDFVALTAEAKSPQPKTVGLRQKKARRSSGIGVPSLMNPKIMVDVEAFKETTPLLEHVKDSSVPLTIQFRRNNGLSPNQNSESSSFVSPLRDDHAKGVEDGDTQTTLFTKEEIRKMPPIQMDGPKSPAQDKEESGGAPNLAPESMDEEDDDTQELINNATAPNNEADPEPAPPESPEDNFPMFDGNDGYSDSGAASPTFLSTARDSFGMGNQSPATTTRSNKTPNSSVSGDGADLSSSQSSLELAEESRPTRSRLINRMSVAWRLKNPVFPMCQLVTLAARIRKEEAQKKKKLSKRKTTVVKNTTRRSSKSKQRERPASKKAGRKISKKK